MAERGEMRWKEEKGQGERRARLRQGRDRESIGAAQAEGGSRGSAPVMRVRTGHSDAV